MKKPSHQQLLLSLILTLLPCSATTVFAQRVPELHPDDFTDEPWVEEVTCKGEAKTGFIGVREFRLCFNFEPNMLQPTSVGTTNTSELTIISYTKKGQGNLSAISIQRVLPEEHPGLAIGTVSPIGPERTSDLSSMRAFKASVQVNNLARSDFYPLTISIEAGTVTGDYPIDLKLPLLAPDSPAIEIKNKQQPLIDCWSGSNCSKLELEARNNSPYRIKILNISVSSDDLLEGKPEGTDYLIELEKNSAPHDLNLVMKSKPIALRRVFSGFGTPKINMRVDYQDEFNRTLSTETIANLEIRPNLVVIAIFLVLGAVVGTFVRIDLGRLQRAGVISQRQRIFVAVSTFVSGLIVCLIALFANIKIIVLSDQNSYSAWDPKVLFLTALVATVSGLPILYAYLKLPPRADTTSPPATNPDKTPNPNP
jgi:hypothetical protein